MLQLHPSLTQAVAHEHVRELQIQASRGRLARLAACCRPSYLARRLAAARERFVRQDAAALACCS